MDRPSMLRTCGRIEEIAAAVIACLQNCILVVSTLTAMTPSYVHTKSSSSTTARSGLIQPMQSELRGTLSYDGHLLFDKAADPRGATARDQFEAFALSVRDVLAQRWASTTETYALRNPKMVYYLSMEFLLGRSLANNVTNLVID